MALVHADFPTSQQGIYGTDESNMLDGIYAQYNGVVLATDPDGISGGLVLNWPANLGSSFLWGIRFVLPSAQPKCGMGGRFWLPSLPTGSNGSVIPFQWRNAGNTAIFTLVINSTGRIEAWRGEHDGVLVATTTNPVVTAGGWYHIEAFIDDTANTLECRVEGVEVLNLSGLTMTSSVYQIFVGNDSTGTGASPAMNLKDFVIWDGSGSANNSFLGSVLVRQLLPDSDVSLNWAPSSGATGWEILDNIPPVDTTYIAAGDPPPSPYVGTLTNLPVDVTSVKGLITIVRAAKSDGGDGSLQIGLISDSAGTPTTGLGADRPITTAFTYWRDVFELDPDTGAAWLPAAVDAVQLQIDRTT